MYNEKYGEGLCTRCFLLPLVCIFCHPLSMLSVFLSSRHMLLNGDDRLCHMGMLLIFLFTQTAEQFEDLYKEETTDDNEKYTFLAALAYDAVWALAQALNNVQEVIEAGRLAGSGSGIEHGCEEDLGQLVPLHEFSYSNSLLGCLIQRSIQNVTFMGVSVSIY